MRPIARVIVDECVGPGSALMDRFQAMFAPTQRVEFVRLTECHRGIPDVEVLRQLLGPDTILLTNDRVLHNQACDLGFRSFTLDDQGNIRRKKLPGISAAEPVAIAGRSELKSDYVHPPHPLARALKQDLSEKAFERYRTRRRRIRSYFGAETNIAGAAVTIGAAAAGKGWLCGFALKLAGKSGVKGLHASEGYSLSPTAQATPAWCVIHALRELYLLQLEAVPAQLYIIPAASLALCEKLLGSPAPAGAIADTQALCRLLKGLAAVQLLPCAKGPFRDRMDRKLAQLARSHSNELVAVPFAQIVTALNNQS